MGYFWTHEEVNKKLQIVMKNIHDHCLKFSGHRSGEIPNYARGANIAGFKKIADAMIAFGV